VVGELVGLDPDVVLLADVVDGLVGIVDGDVGGPGEPLFDPGEKRLPERS